MENKPENLTPEEKGKTKETWKEIFKVFNLLTLLGIAALGLLVGGFVWASMSEVGLVTLILILCGGVLLWIVFIGFKSAAEGLKKLLQEEKEQGVKTTKKAMTKTAVKGAAFCVVCVLLAVTATAAYGAFEVSQKIDNFVSWPMSKTAINYTKVIDEKIDALNPLERLFLMHQKEYAAYKESGDRFLEEKAASMIEKINGLRLCEAITSYEQYEKLVKEIEALSIEPVDLYGQRLLEKVTNYAQFENYKTEFETLLSTYAKSCSSCSGLGYHSSVCWTCSGSGKKVVKWYSEGDWGYESYSTYSCTDCGGDGKESSDCESCVDGKYYDFSE